MIIGICTLNAMHSRVHPTVSGVGHDLLGEDVNPLHHTQPAPLTPSIFPTTPSSQ